MIDFLIKPAEGKRVRCPDGALLTDNGIHAPLTNHWRRARTRGDVTVAPGVADKTAHQPTKKTRSNS